MGASCFATSAQSASPRWMNSAFEEAATAVDAVPASASETIATRTRSLPTLRMSVRRRVPAITRTGSFRRGGRRARECRMPSKAAARLIALALALVALALVPGCSLGGGDDEGVPAFDAADLAEPAGDNWPTAGGSLANDR